MSYLVGGVLVHGDEPSNVIFGAFGQKPSDGGKARIRERRAALNLSEPFTVDDLRMDHVDSGMPSDSPYLAPADDCA